MAGLLETYENTIIEQRKEIKELRAQLEEYCTYLEWQKLLGCVSAQEVIDLTTLNALTDDEKNREIIRLKRKVTHLPVEIISKIRNAFKLERKLDGRKDVNKAFDEVINEVAKGYKQNN